MAIPLIDNEFMKLTVAKDYVRAKQDESNSSDARKALIAEEREIYFQGKGVSYTWEQVKEMALDKSKRHGL